jgi:hypothetical protein
MNGCDWIKKPLVERASSVIILAAIGLICWFSFVHLVKGHNTPKPKTDSLNLIKKAFVIGWQKGSAVTLEQITIHGNNPKAEILINNQYSLDTNEFNKEVK